MNARTKRIFQNLNKVPDGVDNVNVQESDFLSNSRRPSANMDFGSDDSVVDKDYIPNSYSSDSEIEIQNYRLAAQRVKKKLFAVSAKITDDDALIELSDLIPDDPIEHCKTHESHLISDFLAEDPQQSSKQRRLASSSASSASLQQPHSLGTLEPVNTPIRQMSNTNSVALPSPREFEEITNRPVIESETKKRPTKRKRNEALWKRTVAKTKRLSGSAYKSAVAKKNPDIPEKKLKPPCQCKFKCYEKIKAEDREKIWDHFWKKSTSWAQRRQFVANLLIKDIKARQKTNSNLEDDRRKFTYTYFLQVDYTKIKVCQVMFLNTLSVGKKFVKLCEEKLLETGIVDVDKRGHHVPGNKLPNAVRESVKKHIASYPVYESHYSRKKTQKKFLGPELNVNLMYKQYVENMEKENATPKQIAKEWLYRFVFNTEFNLSFKLPGVDTCDDCDKFLRQLKDSKSEEEKAKIQEEKETHLKMAQTRYEMKRKDKEDASNAGSKRVICVDLQKCLPTPNLTNTQSFYLRKQWTLNLTIYDTTSKKTSNFIWPENYAGRGGNEIGSCLIKWAEENLNETIEEITVYSDNCTGQNRNGMIVMAYQWILEKYPHLKIINHKFMLKGHTHMEVDHAHSIIERKKKRLTTMELATPRDWAQFIRTCEGKNPFHVTEMTINNFKDLAALCKKNTAPYIFRKKNSVKADFKISETVWWQMRQEKKGILFYKTELNMSTEGPDIIPFSELSLIRNTKQPLELPLFLKNVRSSEKPISTAKYNDILTLLQWVPENCHEFYKKLIHSSNASDVPEADEED